MMLTLRTIEQLAGITFGTFDVSCPVCGPERRARINQRRRVLRIWRIDENFAGYHCARCGLKGYASDPNAPPCDPAKLERARAEAATRDRTYRAKRLCDARWLWSRRLPIAGTATERYLRRARAYHGPLPATLGFLPAFRDYPPAMIAAFGIPGEPAAPGELAIGSDAIAGIHLTRLLADGSGKAGTEVDKFMIGHSTGSPIVLAPINDGLGLCISEGIENALSFHEATNLGTWAAGCASRLPALAAVVPDYVESVTILVDDDPDGRRFAGELAKGLRERQDIEVREIIPGSRRRVAA